MRSRPTIEADVSWRGDEAWIWVTAIAFVVLLLLTGVLISGFPGAGFWPWLVFAAAIAVGWIVPVVLLIPRSAPRR